jgi:hypothetical protein
VPLELFRGSTRRSFIVEAAIHCAAGSKDRGAPIEILVGSIWSWRRGAGCKKAAAIEEHRGAFQDGHMQSRITMIGPHINTVDAAPVKERSYRLARLKNKVIKEEVEKMFAAYVIQRSTSTSSNAPVLVRKLDGSMRLCVDCRGLNAVSARDNSPVPSGDHTLKASLGYTEQIYV